MYADSPKHRSQEDDYEFSEDSIVLQDDGSFLMRGDADLMDVNTILSLSLADETALKEFATLSGFLCMCAGEIPATGDLIMSRGWCFTVENADDKRVLLAKVERLIGEDESDAEDNSNPIRALLRLSNKDESSDEGANGEADEANKLKSEETIQEDIRRSREANKAEAKEIEQIVAGGSEKISFLKREANNSKEKN